MIVTKCYGKEKQWATKEEAIKFFIECALCSEGSERDRYMTILKKLDNGLDYASDED